MLKYEIDNVGNLYNQYDGMMKKLLLALLAILLFNNIASAGACEIDRVWVEHGYGIALVTYTNETSLTFERAVTIQCTALDHSGNKINISSNSFYASEHGPIRPGFTGTLKVYVKLNGAKMTDMKCNCQQR